MKLHIATALTAFVVLCAATIAATPAAASPSERSPLPVPWNILDAGRAQLLTPGAPPPGSNDWSCRPTAEHPNPVVLVHGGFINQTIGWQTISPLLANAGYCVFSLDYGKPDWPTPPAWTPGAMDPLAENATQIGVFADRVRQETGADKIDVLAQSFGTLSANHYAKYLGGAATIDKFVALSPLWNGTEIVEVHNLPNVLESIGLAGLMPATLDLVQCGVCEQVLQGSDYLTELHRDGTYAPGVTYTNITSRYETLLVFYSTGMRPGPLTRSIDIQDGCPHDLTKHFSIAASPRTAALVLGALDPDDAPPVPCTFNTPLGH